MKKPREVLQPRWGVYVLRKKAERIGILSARRQSLGAILIFVATALALTQAAAQTYSPHCQIAGRYSVEGYVPGSTSPYRGEAVISASGTGCHMKWFPPNDSEGTGDYTGGVLTIYFTFASGGSGV